MPTTYTYQGVTFYRVIEGADFPAWFSAKVTYQSDPILGSTTGQMYTDIAAVVTQPLQIRAACLSEADRTTLRLARGEVGTLANSRGRSRSALLAEAAEVGNQIGGFWFIDLTFAPTT